jgi:hypothetical protein
MKDKPIHGYYITRDNPTVKIQLEPRDEITLSSLDLIELVLPECKKVDCSCNYLTELIIPEGCEVVDCGNNKLISLNIPQSCKQLSCWYNLLTELIIPHGCEVVDCCNNQLNKLIATKTCKNIWCYDNKLPLVIIKLFQSGNPVKIALANSLQR